MLGAILNRVLGLRCQSRSCASKLRPFPIGRNERSMPNDSFNLTEEFLKKMEADRLDDDTVCQLQELSKQQRAELVRLLAERTKRRSTSN